MSWYRRSSAPGLRGNRRRSSVGHSLTPGRRTSLTSSTTSTRVRTSSKGHVIGEEDIEVCLPPLEELPLIPGYEMATFEPSIVPPPQVPLIVETQPSEIIADLKPFTELPHLSEHEVRKILIRYADSKCSHDKNTAREMKLKAVDFQPGYKYTLVSFTESRQVAWSFEPYTGSPLDEPGPTVEPPDPWGIECSQPKPFQSTSLTIDVPHTDVLMTCHVCGGVGSKRCTACSAVGWERCSLCLGDGHKLSLQGQRERCFRCLGTGRKKCWKCGGDTIAVCIGCSGTGQIRCFIVLTITWSNHNDSDILEPPDTIAISEKLEYANGHLIFQDQKPLIPTILFPVSKLQDIATNLLEKHRDLSTTERIILQRHGVWAIPVYYVTYEWKEKQRKFFVYGVKNEVYAPDYPESYCCCVIS